jgi:hypothetical protein
MKFISRFVPRRRKSIRTQKIPAEISKKVNRLYNTLYSSACTVQIDVQ